MTDIEIIENFIADLKAIGGYKEYSGKCDAYIINNEEVDAINRILTQLRAS